MKKSKYSFLADNYEFSLQRILQENVDSSRVILVSNRNKERKVYIVREDVLQNFVGLGAASVATDSQNNRWFVVTRPDAIEQLEEWLEYQANRMWFDVYTWR